MENAEVKIIDGNMYSVIDIEHDWICTGVHVLYGTGYQSAYKEGKHLQDEFVFSRTRAGLYILTPEQEWAKLEPLPGYEVYQLPASLQELWALDGLILTKSETYRKHAER